MKRVDPAATERRRISRELHQQLGQRLSALTSRLASLKREHVGPADLDEQLASLEAIGKQLDADIERWRTKWLRRT